VCVCKCVEEGNWWTSVHVMTWRRGGEGGSESCHNSLHHQTRNSPPTTNNSHHGPTHSLYLNSPRCQGAARSLPSLWLAAEAGPRAGVIDDYGTTASGIMLAGAIYKQKHSPCLCQLQRISPFLSQAPLEKAVQSGSNVIFFYWKSTIPHIEMPQESL